ncbi:MAG: YqhA family protein [Anaerolineae bacterium]
MTSETDKPPEANLPTIDTEGREVRHALLFALVETRWIFVLAVISTFIASVALIAQGTLQTGRILLGYIGMVESGQSSDLRLDLISTIDVFLVATIMYVVSAGLYQLFLNQHAKWPKWLLVSSVGELEEKLIGVLIAVLGVFALERLSVWKGDWEILAFAAAAALIIAALAYYVVHQRVPSDDDD